MNSFASYNTFMNYSNSISSINGQTKLSNIKLKQVTIILDGKSEM